MQSIFLHQLFIPYALPKKLLKYKELEHLGILTGKSKKGSNQKNKGNYSTNWRIYFDSLTPLFWFDLFLEAKAEILKSISLVFERFEDTNWTFWN